MSEDRTRACYIPVPAYMHIQQACALIEQAYGWTVYLVGSALERRDFRDVDLRCIMADEDFDREFGGPGAPGHGARWSLLCAALSTWLSERSGLPVDFQFQRRTQANQAYPGASRRHPMYIFVEAKG